MTARANYTVNFLLDLGSITLIRIAGAMGLSALHVCSHGTWLPSKC
jgi:hypothetical protein